MRDAGRYECDKCVSGYQQTGRLRGWCTRRFTSVLGLWGSLAQAHRKPHAWFPPYLIKYRHCRDDSGDPLQLHDWTRLWTKGHWKVTSSERKWCESMFQRRHDKNAIWTEHHICVACCGKQTSQIFIINHWQHHSCQNVFLCKMTNMKLNLSFRREMTSLSLYREKTHYSTNDGWGPG